MASRFSPDNRGDREGLLVANHYEWADNEAQIITRVIYRSLQWLEWMRAEGGYYLEGGNVWILQRYSSKILGTLVS